MPENWPKLFHYRVSLSVCPLIPICTPTEWARTFCRIAAVVHFKGREWLHRCVAAGSIHALQGLPGDFPAKYLLLASNDS